MTRTTIAIAGTVAVMAIVALAVGVTQLVQAEPGDRTTVESAAELRDPTLAARVEGQAEPAIEMANGQQAISSVQIRAVWADAITKVPGPLAAGDHFPEVEAVDPAAGEEALYEDTMFEYIALEVWRCSWIGEELRNGAAEADLEQLREIDRTIQRFDSKAAQQVVSDRDEMHDDRHTTGTTTLSDYQEELSGASCQLFGLGR